MGLDDDIIIPDFPDDDEPEPGVAAEQAQNRTFLIATAVLAGVFIIGLCVAIFLILGGQPGPDGGDAAAIAQTNAANIAAATETALAAISTATPTSVEVGEATATSTEAATATPTPLLVATQTEVPTTVAEAFATLSETEIAQGTTTPFATVAQPTPLPTIEVTQIGGGDGTPSAPGLPTPTRIVSGVGAPGVTVTALPDTGIGIGTGVAGIGLLALVLVAVVVVARRLRLP